MENTKKKFGPFSFERYYGFPAIRIELDSTGCEDECAKRNVLTLQFYSCIFRILLPVLIKPYKKWVDTSKESWSTGPNSGYMTVFPRQYGFCVMDGHLSIYYGEQTHDSSTSKHKGYFLPWLYWRHTRMAIYDKDLNIVYEEFPQRKPAPKFCASYEFKQSMEKVIFKIKDYDGEIITVSTFVQQLEWKLGKGFFTWLSLFTKTKIRRSLSMEFDKELGPQKGSWKGGILGTGIDMEPGEKHIDAMKRFCSMQHREKHNARYQVEFIE